MALSDLPPLHKTYEPYADEHSSKVELKMEKCKHELYLVSSTEAKCRKCSVGYMGSGIVKLVQATQ
jgi:hypothetical protein